jgi:hypothetical protein
MLKLKYQKKTKTFKIPNYKFQIPNKFQIPMTKIPNVWKLEFGA